MGVKAQEITGDKTENPIAKVNSPSPEQILEGIAEFKKVTPLTKNKAPQYSDDSATIYLYLPSSAISGKDSYLARINVPHPLSFNRRVCFFLRDKAAEEYKAPLIATMKEMGIQDIKVVLRSEVESAINENATESLEETIKTYDTLVSTKNGIRTVGLAIDPILRANGKFLQSCEIQALKHKIAFFAKPSLGGYTIKIGHTGFSEEQLLENIQAALTGVTSVLNLRQGLSHFKTVILKTGTTPGVAIYTNKGKVVPEPMKEIHSEPQARPQMKLDFAADEKKIGLKIREKNAANRAANRAAKRVTPVVKGNEVVMITESPAGKKKKSKKQKAAASPVQSVVQLSTVGKKMKNKIKKAAASPVRTVDQVSPEGKKLQYKKQKVVSSPMQSVDQVSTVGKKLKNKK